MQEWTREAVNAEYMNQQEMTQKMIFAEERFEHESRQNTLRCHEEVRDYIPKCEAYMRQECSTAVQLKSQMDHWKQSSTQFEQKCRMFETEAESFRNRSLGIEQAASDSVMLTQRHAAELAQMVVAHTNEAQAAQKMIRDVEERERQALQYFHASAQNDHLHPFL
jgi:hypothetical protein